MTAAALVVMICLKRCRDERATTMLFACFVYYLKLKDAEAVDLTSKRQVSWAFTRFREYERRISDEGRGDEWYDEVGQSMVDMKEAVVEYQQERLVDLTQDD